MKTKTAAEFEIERLEERAELCERHAEEHERTAMGERPSAWTLREFARAEELRIEARELQDQADELRRRRR